MPSVIKSLRRIDRATDCVILAGSLAWKNTVSGSSADDTVEGTVQRDTRAINFRTVKLENLSGSGAATVYTGGGQFTATRK